MAYAAGNIVDFVRGFGQRKEDAQVKGALQNYLTDPQASIQAVNAINPDRGIPLAQAYEDRSTQLAKAAQATKDSEAKRYAAGIQGIAGSLRKVRDAGGDIGTAFDGLTPVFTNGFQMKPEEIADWKQRITENPAMIDALSAEAEKLNSATPGSWVYGQDGKVRFKVPEATKTMVVPNESGGRDVIQLPGNGGAEGGVPSAGAAPGAGGGGVVDPVTTLGQTMPGVVFTSGRRTAAGNAAVGGAESSEHLGGHSLDIIPGRSGLTPQQIAANVRAQGGKALIEKDHVHATFPGSEVPYIGTRGSEGQGPDTITAGASGITPVYSTRGKPTEEKGWRPATPQEKIANNIDPAAPYQIGIGGANNGLMRRSEPISAAGKTPPVTTPGKLTTASGATVVDMYARMRDQAQRIVSHPSFAQATGSIQGRIPSFRQGSQDFDKQVESLKSQMALNATNILKSLNTKGSSPLGNTSDSDAKRLENFGGSLDQTAPDTLQRTARDIIKESQFQIGRQYNIPDGATEMLINSPKMAKQFDEQFGAGLARKILGR